MNGLTPTKSGLTRKPLAYIMFPHMEKYAVIKTGGKQYKISEGDILEVEKLDLGEKKKDIEFDQVLLYSDEKSTKVGKPTLSVSVKASLIGNVMGEKVRASKFKAKTQYHRTVGHRQKLTQVKIEKIETN